MYSPGAVSYFNDRESANALDTICTEPHTVFKVLFVNFVESRTKDKRLQQGTAEEDSHKSANTRSTVTPNYVDEKVASCKHIIKSKTHPFNSSGIPGEDRDAPRKEHVERVNGGGKVVKVQDMALAT